MLIMSDMTSEAYESPSERVEKPSSKKCELAREANARYMGVVVMNALETTYDGVSEDWMSRAACGGVDPELFFPANESAQTAVKAQEVCAECPVNGMCLRYALKHQVQYGIWGGLITRDRNQVRHRLYRGFKG